MDQYIDENSNSRVLNSDEEEENQSLNDILQCGVETHLGYADFIQKSNVKSTNQPASRITLQMLSTFMYTKFKKQIEDLYKLLKDIPVLLLNPLQRDQLVFLLPLIGPNAEMLCKKKIDAYFRSVKKAAQEELEVLYERVCADQKSSTKRERTDRDVDVQKMPAKKIKSTASRQALNSPVQALVQSIEKLGESNLQLTNAYTKEIAKNAELIHEKQGMQERISKLTLENQKLSAKVQDSKTFLKSRVGFERLAEHWNSSPSALGATLLNNHSFKNDFLFATRNMSEKGRAQTRKRIVEYYSYKSCGVHNHSERNLFVREDN